MKAWSGGAQTVSPAGSPPVTGLLTFGGGIDGIGVTSGTPRVYLVFWGSQWSSGGDPNGAATYLQNFYSGIGTGGETWSGTMMQYCDGPLVATGATSCPSGAPTVGYPSSGALAGVWFDSSAAAPGSATQAQLAAEAVNAAAHFGNTTVASNRYAQYIVVSPSGTQPDGFPSAGFCAWHSDTPSSYGDIAYTNLPYVTDAGSGCGENFVNTGSAGTLDGFSIVGGHEYAETLTDQNPTGGWANPSNRNQGEDGDECAWISSGPGALANVSMGNGTYAMQSTWSNQTGGCDISEPQIFDSFISSCNGSYRIIWSSMPTATSYKVWVQSGSPGYTLLKTTTATGTRVVTGPGSSDYEVQACVGTLCGPLSSPYTLAYYSGCP
jgi:serine protease